MRILYVSAEVVPFAASGGLGDVMGALPKSLKALYGDGCEVSVVMPLYTSIPPCFREQMQRVCELGFMYGWRQSYVGVHRLVMDGVNYYFIDNRQYFLRDSLYGQHDDGERFAYFCRAVIEMLMRMPLSVDILHAHDWQAALSVVYLKTRFRTHPLLAGIKTMFTIHNIEYQGKFDPYLLGDIFDLDSRYLSVLSYGGALNLLKGALVCADALSTVSPRYAKELEEVFFAHGLSDIVRAYTWKLRGVLNGIDQTMFSPTTGGDIPCPYEQTDAWEGKAQNKAALQEKLGLTLSAECPLLVMVTRLTEAKGLDLVLRAFGELMALPVQFVLLGTGDRHYEEAFTALCAQYPGQARSLIRFDRALSKQLYAAADLFLMPSKSEPCGLAQMIACRYGTLPVVRAVGGLADSIIPQGKSGANGFVFQNFHAQEMMYQIKDALALYRRPALWQRLMHAAMQSDFSWDASSRVYAELYRQLLSQKQETLKQEEESLI